LKPLFDIEGKIALVTGGAQGLGRMIASGLVEGGAKVYITSRKSGIAEQAARELSPAGNCHALTANLAAPEAAVVLAGELKSREQRFDILINNAGKSWGAPLRLPLDQAISPNCRARSTA
jgi:NAD(P)-dependent dehydrogenase (short-subunit alcohol dehydrogenase family)